METERNGRKVLFSIKVSTLLTILLTVIVTIVTINLVCDKVNAQKKEVAAEQVAIVDVKGEEELKVSAVEQLESEEVEIHTRYEATARSINRRDYEKLINPTTPIEEVTISRDMDLTVRTGLSREDFITLMTNLSVDTSGFFEENAGLIYDSCEKYQINEIFFVGLISAESGWNIASNHRRTHNYISLMSANGLIRYSTVEEGIDTAAKVLHDKYLTPGGAFYFGPTLSGVKTRFCPASSTWVNLVYGRMNQVI